MPGRLRSARHCSIKILSAEYGQSKAEAIKIVLYAEKSDPHHIRGDLRQRMRTAHLHGVGQFPGKLIDVALHTLCAAAVDSSHEGAADQNAVCTQCQCLEHIHTGADAAIFTPVPLRAAAISGSTSAVAGH